MPKDTFDGLKDILANGLFVEEKSLKEVIGILRDARPTLDPLTYQMLITEISLIGNKIREVATCSDKLYNKAIRDGVTGLHTRSYLDEYIELAQIAHTSRSINLAYIMSDIDHFKRYNDTYGHIQGDMALWCVADTFKSTLESTLIEGERVFTAKYGGEEFCAFIENFKSDNNGLLIRLDEVRRKVECLKIGIDKCVNPTDEGYKTASITIAGGIINPGEYIKALMSRVDDILKEKDKRGRNKAYIAI